ncbi:GntR family transcriptional regulator [Fusobacterium sp.]|uniref:GntR family transcriptional regulator n=1 Tax=Fusobacterium sp. TaxID=68766 RepID=UPI00290473DD|nr:GntR family transcriptional regulator [Fusobacterium sp.]MDU1910934.1 GntR family transcriptional regulator [Fusobacterium sp.]
MKFIKLDNKKTLSEKVYDRLKELIMDGELERGTKITETSIAKMFDVSPTPVREAFRKLASDGLIEVASWKGVIVKGIEQKDLLEIYECREALEGMVGKLAVRNITEEDIKVLEKILEKCNEAKTPEILIELNTEFHNELLKIAGNQRLSKLLNELMVVILYDRDISGRYSVRRKEIVQEHLDILEYLKKRDEKKVSELMAKHIKNGYEFIKNHNK